MKKWIRDKKNSFTDSPERLSPEQADKILENIMDNLDFDTAESLHETSGKSYRHLLIRKYILKNGLILGGIFLLLFLFMPGTLVPAPISNVSAVPASDSSSAQVEFKISSLIPVQQVSAQTNDHTLDLEETGYQTYSVNVKENGYLLLEVYSISGMRSSHEMKIDTIDDQEPHIVSHHREGDEVVIYFSDEGGSGVDYAAIQAYMPETDTYMLPAYYDEDAGCAAFSLPPSPAYITVPDKSGNEMTALLTPPDSSP